MSIAKDGSTEKRVGKRRCKPVGHDLVDHFEASLQIFKPITPSVVVGGRRVILHCHGVRVIVVKHTVQVGVDPYRDTGQTRLTFITSAVAVVIEPLPTMNGGREVIERLISKVQTVDELPRLKVYEMLWPVQNGEPAGKSMT